MSIIECYSYVGVKGLKNIYDIAFKYLTLKFLSKGRRQNS